MVYSNLDVAIITGSVANSTPTYTLPPYAMMPGKEEQ
jgi:hypothetical protein